MKQVAAILVLCLTGATAAVAQNSDPAKVTAYLSTLPAATSPTFDEAKQETLATSAILCSDHPDEAPVNRNSYLWQYQKNAQILDGYDRNRAFFGCGNWHDAVASVWMMISTLKQNPKISLSSDIKDIANTHFRKTNMDGELEYFSGERPTPRRIQFRAALRLRMADQALRRGQKWFFARRQEDGNRARAAGQVDVGTVGVLFLRPEISVSLRC